MAFFDRTLDSKSTIIDANGNEIVDLTTNDFGNPSDIISYTIYENNEHYEMRPDLCSINVYKNDTGTELILKYSGIGPLQLPTIKTALAFRRKSALFHLKQFRM